MLFSLSDYIWKELDEMDIADMKERCFEYMVKDKFWKKLYVDAVTESMKTMLKGGKLK